jgi:hypothetical protein
MASTTIIVWVIFIGIAVVGAVAAACAPSFMSLTSLVKAWREATRKTWWPKGRVSPYFTGSDFLDLPAIIQKLIPHADPMSKCVWSQCSDPTRQLLGDNNMTLEQKRHALVEGLNDFLRRNSIANRHCFAGIQLSNGTLELMSRNPQGETLFWLNRLLLQDAFPGEIAVKEDGSVESEIDPEEALRLAIQCRFRAAALFLGFAGLAIAFTTILLGNMPPAQEKGSATKSTATNSAAFIPITNLPNVTAPTSNP